MEDESHDAMDSVWELVKSTAEEFELAGRINGFDSDGYIEYIENQAQKDLGDGFEKDLAEYIDNEVRQTIDREIAVRDEWLRHSGLKRMQQWRIRQRPLDKWRSGQKARRVDVPVRIINVPAMNRCLAGDDPECGGVKLDFIGDRDFKFIDLIIYSTLCSFWDRGIKSVTMRRLLEQLNPAEQWRRRVHDAFVKSVEASIDRLYEIGIEINGEPGMLLDSQVAGDSIVMQSQSKLWEHAEGKAGMISIPVEWLKSGRCKIDWLDRIYVARRVRLANYQDSTMPPKISLDSMFRTVGHNVSPDVIISYLAHLVRLGSITDPSIEKGTVSWTPCEKTKA